MSAADKAAVIRILRDTLDYIEQGDVVVRAFEADIHQGITDVTEDPTSGFMHSALDGTRSYRLELATFRTPEHLRQ